MMALWQRLVAFCLSLTAVLIAAGLVGRWGRRMFNTNRKFSRFLDQVLGDAAATPPIPSLMEQVGQIREEQNRQAAWQAEHDRPRPRQSASPVARHRKVSSYDHE